MIKVKSILINVMRCPGCNQWVFNYTTEDISRILFEDVGEPWMLHDCTGFSVAPDDFERFIAAKPDIPNKELEKMREFIADRVEETEYVVEIEAYVGSPKQFIGRRQMSLAEARKQLPDLVEHFGDRKMR
jgi:hypothetical protein